MSKLQEYLEMLPIKKTREMMGKHANTEETKFEKAPQWLLDDVTRKLEPNKDYTLKDIATLLSVVISKGSFKPAHTDMRVVLTPTMVLKGESRSTIHQTLIVYGMCIGAIPLDEDFSDYKWTLPIRMREARDHFICLEYVDGVWILAESYDYYAAEELLEYLKIYKKYDSILKQIGVNAKDIQLNDESHYEDDEEDE